MNKKELRKDFLNIRDEISREEKISFDELIYNYFIKSDFFKNYDSFLVYVSIRSEVETVKIIDYLLRNGKSVSVPYCKNQTMYFYSINSLDDLIVGAFGIPSVDISISDKTKNFNNTLCIVPAISFDNNGNRLGYGGGYYDRFLSEYKLPTLGLCYEKCISDFIPSESFDIKINYVLTEKYLRNHITKEVSTYG